MKSRLIACLLAIVCGAAPAAAQKVTKETFGSGNSTRTYYLLVPDAVKEKGPAPLILLLHGSGRDGRSLMDKWEPLGKKEGVILAAPDALIRDGWRIPEDGPDFLYGLVEMLRIQHDVDPRRIYLFGHSAGAGHALVMALLESEYFAAIAVHAGALRNDTLPLIERATRKTPIGIWVGTNDDLFPLPLVRATRDALKAQGFAPELTEIPRHTHWYYDRAPEINRSVWAFLQKHALQADPKFQRYELNR